MSRVLKWELRVPGDTRLELRTHDRIVSVAFQGERLFAWTLSAVEGRPTREVVVRVIETGEYAPSESEGWAYLASAHGMWRGQPYVAHVFIRERALP